MADVDVHIALSGQNQPLGLLRRHASRGGESITFEYDDGWLASTTRFAIDPALPLTRGVFTAATGKLLIGSIGDSAPDTWGRRLMQRAERHNAEREGRRVRTLSELDYLLGVSDETRLGALRFSEAGQKEYQAPLRSGVPAVVELGNLLNSTDRILRNEESDTDLQLVLAPGSSLGGARPKASVVDQHGHLSIAKFPKETDEYSIETWEEIALRLADNAGITTAEHELIQVQGRAVLLSRRFDRQGMRRIPFLSAMSLTGSLDGEGGSYPEIIDDLVAHGGSTSCDAKALYRRMSFNVLVSNVDDHLRNHGFLWSGKGWTLSPAYDLNPTPLDVKARVLNTAITLDERTCSLDLLEEAAGLFGLALPDARAIIKSVATATRQWRTIARQTGATRSGIERMATAFEHDDLERALLLS